MKPVLSIMLLGTLALAGIVCLVNAFRSERELWWLGYYLFTTLACYTHLAASFLLPFEGVLILVALRARFRQAWKPAFIALGAIGLTFLPFAWNVWQVSGPSHNVLREPLRFDQLLHNATLQLSTYERALPSWQAWGVVLLIGGVFGLGVFWGREAPWAPRGFARLLAALHYLLFLLVMIILSLREPVYQPKSLTFVGAALALGVGAGWARIWQWRRVAGGAVGVLLMTIQFYGIGGLWRLETHKEDWRHAVAYVTRQVGPDDMVLVHLEYYQVVFRYYFRGTTPVIAPFGSHLPAPEEIDRILRQYQNYAVIWLAQSGEYITDQEHRVQRWLESQYPEVTEVYPSGILIKGYAVHYRTASLPSAATPAAVKYPNGLTLVGYRVPESSLPVNDLFLHPPSTWVHVTLYWSVAQSLTEDIRVAITLEDEGGNVWGSELPRAGDLRAFYPPLQWQPGEIIRQDFDVNTNPAVPPGEYKLVLRVFPAGSDAPLPHASGQDWRSLSPIVLTR